MQLQEARDFIERFEAGKHSEVEHIQFIDWLKRAPIEQVEKVAEEYKIVMESKSKGVENPELVSHIEAALDQYELGKEKIEGKGKVVYMQRFRKIAIAASIILALVVGSYFVFFNKAIRKDDVVKINEPIPHDVKAPGKNRAMIMMKSGERIYLDSVTNGKLLQQDGLEIVKLADGKIVYSQVASTASRNDVAYNTLSNPKGSTAIDMTLSDGSKVWLNAGSSVTFPMVFIGNERKVSISGEAYFEVAHDATKPFFVSKGATSVQVLGTHFNVNAYDDEADIKVTLLEGSVRIIKNAESKMLKPGQQGVVSSDIKVLNEVNVDEVMAWKNGRFELSGNTIEPIMRQVARWYDVEVEYKGDKPNVNFMGGTSRQENVSELLKILEETNAVKFKIDGRKIIVSK